MKKSGKIALCGIITALSVIFMFLAGLIPLTTYAAPAFAGILLLSVVIETSRHYAFLVYIATSILSFIIIPNREASIFYISLFGYYPIIKELILKISNKFLCLILKLLIFNISFFLIYYLAEKIFLIPHEAMDIMGPYGVYIFIFLANFAFLLYDLLIDRVSDLYLLRIQSKLTKLFK